MGSIEVDIEMEAGVNLEMGSKTFLEVDKLEVSWVIYFILSSFFYSFDIKLGLICFYYSFAIFEYLRIFLFLILLLLIVIVNTVCSNTVPSNPILLYNIQQNLKK